MAPASPQGRGARPRRWPRRLLIGVNAFLVVCILLAGGAYLYVNDKLGAIGRVVVGRLKPDDPGSPMNVLLVGSDTRANLTGREAQQLGKDEVGGQRSDTMMLLHVDPREKKAAILSIPRDLWVPIAGTTGSNRVNTAFEGGPDRLVATLQGALGVKIHHYAQVDFIGFRGIVDAIGGVPIYLPARIRDRKSGLDIREVGCVTLSPDQALAYVRSRNTQFYESGSWRTDPTADLGRISRQQDFIRRVLRRAIAKGARNPFTFNRLINSGVRNVTLDQGFSTRDILKLAKRFRSLSPETVDTFTVPVTQGRVGRAAVLFLKKDELQPIIDRFNGVRPPDPGAAPPPAPSAVRVRVLNGIGVAGLAGKTAVELQQRGFVSAGTGDADRYGYKRSVIRYGRGQRPKADLLRRYLSSGAVLQEDLSLQGVSVELLVGADYSGVRTRPVRATPGETSTTLPEPTSKPAPRGAPAGRQC